MQHSSRQLCGIQLLFAFAICLSANHWQRACNHVVAQEALSLADPVQSSGYIVDTFDDYDENNNLIERRSVFNDNNRFKTATRTLGRLRDGVQDGLRPMQHTREHQKYFRSTLPLNDAGYPGSARFKLNQSSVEYIDKRAADTSNGQQLFTYVVSPWSQQILPFRSDKLAQGYRNFFTLASANQNYRIGLQKSNELNERVLDTPFDTIFSTATQCRAIKIPIELTREDVISVEPLERIAEILTNGNVLSKIEKQLVRTCRGVVDLNRCDGSCASNVQPSVRVRGGFKKECFCCNEGSFKRTSVRLEECFLPLENNKRIMPNDNRFGAKWMSFMDIEVEEPIDCKCRQCENAS